MHLASCEPYPLLLQLPEDERLPKLRSFLPQLKDMLAYHVRAVLEGACLRTPLPAFLGAGWNCGAFISLHGTTFLDAQFLYQLGIMQGAGVACCTGDLLIGQLLRTLVLEGSLRADVPVVLHVNGDHETTISCYRTPCGLEQPLALVLRAFSPWRVPTVLGVAAHMLSINCPSREYVVPRTMQPHLPPQPSFHELVEVFTSHQPLMEYQTLIKLYLEPLPPATTPEGVVMTVRDVARDIVHARFPSTRLSPPFVTSATSSMSFSSPPEISTTYYLPTSPPRPLPLTALPRYPRYPPLVHPPSTQQNESEGQNPAILTTTTTPDRATHEPDATESPGTFVFYRRR